MYKKTIKKNDKNHILKLVQGDITEQETDAIVNAANSNLVLGSGVAGAIRKKGGPSIQNECNEIGSTPVGTAAMTGAGQLKAKKVIHAVGPVYSKYEPQKARELLDGSVKSSLSLLEENDLKSISFPAISTGVFGYPKKNAARTIINAILDYLEGAQSELEIRLCLFGESDYKLFEKIAKKILNESGK